mmetsp:Transcript_7181/g.15439  ORF Transcript_7181/g.15439 Transcript_7181/m.15439 type:complete len:111 (+) Transcript_7181:140-472(+)
MARAAVCATAGVTTTAGGATARVARAAVGATVKASQRNRPVPGMAKTGPCAAPAVGTATAQVKAAAIAAKVAAAKACMSAEVSAPHMPAVLIATAIVHTPAEHAMAQEQR